MFQRFFRVDYGLDTPCLIRLRKRKNGVWPQTYRIPVGPTAGTNSLTFVICPADAAFGYGPLRPSANKTRVAGVSPSHNYYYSYPVCPLLGRRVGPVVRCLHF